MKNGKKMKVVGVYENEHEAIKAIEELKKQGYSSDEISVLSKEKDVLADLEEVTGSKAMKGMEAGVVTGGVLGGGFGLIAGIVGFAIPGFGPVLAAGPIAMALAGSAAGVGIGGLAGTLVGLGISDEDAARYESDIKEGKILVLVEDHDPLLNESLDSPVTKKELASGYSIEKPDTPESP
jgi:Heat induced stress protein YflT